MDLKDVFDYRPETGDIMWRIKPHPKAQGIYPGKIGGCIKPRGYRKITFEDYSYSCHRLAWYLTYGYWPKEIDHINGDKSDNRLCNLRETDKRGNQQNQKRHRAGKLVGAHWSKRKQRWLARVTDPSAEHSHTIGSFKTEKEANEAYIRYVSTLQR